MLPLLLSLLFAAPPPASFDLDLDHLPPYARTAGPPAATPTPLPPVDWDSPAPHIRTAAEFREAKDRVAPVIWFEGKLYFLTPEGEYRDSVVPLEPTPTPRPYGDVEFMNATAGAVEFHFRPFSRPEQARSAAVPPYSSQRAVLPLGIWEYAVTGAPPGRAYPSRGEFSVEPWGVTRVLFGFPGRSIERARDWIHEQSPAPAGPPSATGAPERRPADGALSLLLGEIPLYPNALRMDLPPGLADYALLKTLDDPERILAFYDRVLREQGWELLERRENRINALKADRKAVVEILPSPPGGVSRQVLLRLSQLQ